MSSHAKDILGHQESLPCVREKEHTKNLINMTDLISEVRLHNCSLNTVHTLFLTPIHCAYSKTRVVNLKCSVIRANDCRLSDDDK